jgi:thymidylate kinase
MTIHYIDGPAACGKTRHLDALKAIYEKRGVEVLGPIDPAGVLGLLRSPAYRLTSTPT